jgi:hypothetical protein
MSTTPESTEAIWPLVFVHEDLWRMCREMAALGTEPSITPDKLFAGAWIGILLRQRIIMVNCSNSIKGVKL